MATDAKFDRIQKIIPHDNADSLEIAIVSNFPCVVRKGEFREGDWCFYIRDDAKLMGWDEYQERINRDKEAAKTGAFVTQDCFTCTWQWQDNLLKYLGSGGRVKSIKLRGKVSMGILLKPGDVLGPLVKKCYNCSNCDFEYSCAEALNNRIGNPDTGAAYLEQQFGITHWSAPTTGFGAMNVKYAGLPCGLEKSDEDNWENLDKSDLHLGSRCLITKKLDGTSTTVTCFPDGKYEISSRSQTFNVESMEERGEENIYTKFTKDAVRAGLWYAKNFNTTIAIRGETCCGSVQNSSYNKDCKLEGFFVYGCEFPDKENFFERHGTYGTKFHFTSVINQVEAGCGITLKTVPIIEEEVVTKDLLRTYNDMPWGWGEGIVVNIKVDDINSIPESLIWHYKSKSREYLMKMK